MWEIDSTGTRAEYKRCTDTLVACAAVIRIDDQECDDVIRTFDTIDEAKIFLAKYVADKNAEEET